ncbi:hypothetical protein P7D85_17530 [Enterococcus hulanensis]|uniref:Uncharacterized protein n=1 Tax=Enterococcus hulanensis TaxID=2559929 RepID=A0ABU3F377_9ENTE|nr:hypothetical protein [Enterococcus hulanensis]MDT2601583.1 hypothetical protein [Enterococcus hulanensis]MDT2609275.1 hypothetical protein [Enterococcus hulanensis]MDT2616684.1 hypothetical protein [Enterococcus hulanensis]MDT2629605.1 hypothetical protein [Enterococcus hulanensis]MDT2657080.1 hypothetical protein [Enterococcus hulanensis]
MGILIIITILIMVLAVVMIFVLRDKERIEEGEPKKEVSIVNEAGNKNDSRDVSKVTELLLKNNLGNELVFKRPDIEASKEKKYREVSFSQVNQVSGSLVNVTMPILQQVVTAERIAKNAPNGLFTTLAKPETLSKFSDGSFTTMVRDARNKLISHEGFTQVTDIAKGNPLVAINASMQAMAMVSGQYYLHEINTQLEEISEKLNELLNVHNDEKIGMLLTVKERLLVISKKENVDTHDISEIRGLIKDARNVFAEYRVRLSRQQDNLNNLKSKNIFEKSKIAMLEEIIKDLNFTIKIVYEADQLSNQAELSEIAVRMKLNDSAETIQELTSQLKDHYEKSFYGAIDNFVKKEYRPAVQAKYRELGNKYLLKHPEHLKRINDSVSLSELRTMNSSVGELMQQLIKEYNKEQEILYVPGDDTNPQRVFVAVE